MHIIRLAELQPGARVEDLPRPPSVSGPEAHPIRGRALIFWDPKLAGTRYGRKLDAIDTDQITPAAD
ncbi:MAG TPA: hypothetical protein VL693_12160, partial [Vicinamibacterales bacterium]|nr:hypothetical protein [Vicinamibacterales bacterium]